MNRKISVLGILALSLSCGFLLAQNSNTLALERAAMEEQYKILTGQIARLLETQEVLLKRQDEFKRNLDSLAREIDKVRDESSRGNVNFVTREELKSVVNSMKEIEEKREADKKLILQSIQDLAKLPPMTADSKKRDSKPTLKERETTKEKDKEEGSSSSVAETLYEYQVQRGDTLEGIIAAYNQEYKNKGEGNISMDDVLKANERLKPNRIYEGQKILIPAPAKSK